jgi:hypothetical protein
VAGGCEFIGLPVALRLLFLEAADGAFVEQTLQSAVRFADVLQDRVAVAGPAARLERMRNTVSEGGCILRTKRAAIKKFR